MTNKKADPRVLMEQLELRRHFNGTSAATLLAEPFNGRNLDEAALQQSSGVAVTSIADPAPLTISSASIKIAKHHVAESHSNTASGTVFGTGNGTIKYRWLVEEPNGNVLKASGVLAAKMSNGIVSIPQFSGLSSYYAGVYRTWIRVVKPGTRLDSNARTYTVTGAPPGIYITNTPAYGSSGDAQGSVVGVNPVDYEGVAVFIEVGRNWWTKPYWDAPITKIARNGTWQAEIVTGGEDQDATEVAAFLVPFGFEIPLADDDPSLPSQLFSLVYTELARN